MARRYAGGSQTDDVACTREWIGPGGPRGLQTLCRVL